LIVTATKFNHSKIRGEHTCTEHVSGAERGAGYCIVERQRSGSWVGFQCREECRSCPSALLGMYNRLLY